MKETIDAVKFYFAILCMVLFFAGIGALAAEIFN